MKKVMHCFELWPFPSPLSMFYRIIINTDLFSCHSEYAKIHSTHKQQRQVKCAEGINKNVVVVPFKRAVASLFVLIPQAPVHVLQFVVHHVPAQVDGHKGHGQWQGPDGDEGQRHPQRGDPPGVAERSWDGQVSVHADRHQGQDGGGTQHDVQREVDVTQGSPQGPFPVTQLHGSSQGQHQQAQQQIRHCQCHHEAVGDGPQSTAEPDSQTHQHVPTDGQNDEGHQDEPAEGCGDHGAFLLLLLLRRQATETVLLFESQ